MILRAICHSEISSQVSLQTYTGLLTQWTNVLDKQPQQHLPVQGQVRETRLLCHDTLFKLCPPLGHIILIIVVFVCLCLGDFDLFQSMQYLFLPYEMPMYILCRIFSLQVSELPDVRLSANNYLRERSRAQTYCTSLLHWIMLLICRHAGNSHSHHRQQIKEYNP